MAPAFTLEQQFANNSTALQSSKVGHAYVLTINWKRSEWEGREMPRPKLPYCPEIPYLAGNHDECF